MVLTDFHIHSTFSDGSLSIPEIVDLYGRAGFGAIAITDHVCEETTGIGKAAAYLGKSLTRESFPLYLEILKSERERAWAQYQMLLIPGVELTKNSLFNHRSAHIVALGIYKWISADCDLNILATQIRDQGGLSVAAHPLSPHPVKNKPYYLWDRQEELKNLFDVWEISFANILLPEVLKSNLPKIANSDLHHPKQMSAWRTRLFCRKTEDEIFKALRAQELEFEFFGEGKDAVDQPLARDFWGQSLGYLASA